MKAFLEKLGITRFAMYVMDFGGPIGYRLILKYPDGLEGFVVQNTPAFAELIGEAIWRPNEHTGSTGRRRIGTQSGPS